jgi:hypothetical protein
MPAPAVLIVVVGVIRLERDRLLEVLRRFLRLAACDRVAAEPNQRLRIVRLRSGTETSSHRSVFFFFTLLISRCTFRISFAAASKSTSKYE